MPPMRPAGVAAGRVPRFPSKSGTACPAGRVTICALQRAHHSTLSRHSSQSYRTSIPYESSPLDSDDSLSLTARMASRSILEMRTRLPLRERSVGG